MLRQTFFKQNKFNLLREESEGYSKLVTELETSAPFQPPAVVSRNIQALVGFFDVRVCGGVVALMRCSLTRTACWTWCWRPWRPIPPHAQPWSQCSRASSPAPCPSPT